MNKILKKGNQGFLIPDALIENAGVISATFGSSVKTLALSGLSENTLYKLYIVPGGNLVASANNNSVGPSSYDSWLLVGAFYSNQEVTPGFGAFVNIDGIPTSGTVDLEVIMNEGAQGSIEYEHHFWWREGEHYRQEWRVVHDGAGTTGSGDYGLNMARGFEVITPDAGRVTANRAGSFSLSRTSDPDGLMRMGHPWRTNNNNDAAWRFTFVGASTGDAWDSSASNHDLGESDLRVAVDIDVKIEGWSNTPLKDL